MKIKKSVACISRENALKIGFKEKAYRPWPKNGEPLGIIIQGKFVDLHYRREDSLVYLGTVIDEVFS
jgi:hypothetical protein